MTSRSFLLALGAGLFVLSGCTDRGATGGGTANLDSLATGDPADLLAYNAGFQTADQLLQQDSSFSFDRFREGFAAGLRGDSTEIAYALGLRAGLGLHADTVSNIDPDMFLAGLRERSEKKDSRVSPDQVSRAETVFNDSLRARQTRAAEATEMQALRDSAATNPAAKARLDQMGPNLAASQRFLAEVARRPGIQKTASGIFYTTQTEGSGASPTEADQVQIRYVGKLADGTTFDQSPGTEAVTLPVGAVVPGFAEALKLMKPGDKRTFFIPPSLAYGPLGSPGPNGTGGIPPNSALEFEITLVGVAPQQQMPQGMFQGQ